MRIHPLLILVLFIPFWSLLSDASETQQNIIKTPASKVQTIVIMGDSLTEGYGIQKDLAFPKLIEKNLNAKGHTVRIVNAGISGSTSASASGRLKWILKQKPDILFLALGANDGLRGIPPSETRNNLKSAIEIAKKNGLTVWLAGMKMPPNYGSKFTKQFEQIFAELANEFHVPFYSFLLQGVAGDPTLSQSDKIHPNEKGHQILANKLTPFFLKNLKEKP